MIRLIYSLTYLNARSAWVEERLGYRLDGLPDVGVLQRTVDDTSVQPFACLAFHLRFALRFPRGNPNGEFLHGKIEEKRGEKEERNGNAA